MMMMMMLVMKLREAAGKCFCYADRGQTFDAAAGTVSADADALAGASVAIQFGQADGLRRRGSGGTVSEAQRDQRSAPCSTYTHSFSLMSVLDVHRLLLASVLVLLPIGGCNGE